MQQKTKARDRVRKAHKIRGTKSEDKNVLTRLLVKRNKCYVREV